MTLSTRLAIVVLLASCSRPEPVGVERQGLEPGAPAHRLLLLSLTAGPTLDLLDSRVVPLPLPSFRGDPELPWQLRFQRADGTEERSFEVAHDEVRVEYPGPDGLLRLQRAPVEKPVFPARVPLESGVLTLLVRRGDAFVERAALRLEAAK